MIGTAVMCLVLAAGQFTSVERGFTDAEAFRQGKRMTQVKRSYGWDFRHKAQRATWNTKLRLIRNRGTGRITVCMYG